MMEMVMMFMSEMKTYPPQIAQQNPGQSQAWKVFSTEQPFLSVYIVLINATEHSINKLVLSKGKNPKNMIEAT